MLGLKIDYGVANSTLSIQNIGVANKFRTSLFIIAYNVLSNVLCEEQMPAANKLIRPYQSGFRSCNSSSAEMTHEKTIGIHTEQSSGKRERGRETEKEIFFALTIFFCIFNEFRTFVANF